jgi:hypothetical protein
MANNIKITCSKCNEVGKVSLSNVSSQRCENCGNFYFGADTGVPVVTRKRQRKRTWRSIFTTQASEDAQRAVDPDSPVHEENRMSIAWMPIMLLLAIGLTIGLTYYFIDLEKKRSNRVSTLEPDDLVEQTSLQGKVISAAKAMNDKRLSMGDFAPLVQEIDPVWAGKVAAVAQQFLSSTNIDEVLKLVRNAPQFEKQIREELTLTGRLPISKEGIDDLLYTPNDDIEKSPLALLFFRNREETTQGIVLTDTPQGILVDWPSLSGCGEMSVEEFLTKRPTEPTIIRVAARKIDYYNFEFLDKDTFQSLRMTEYPEKTVIYGYAKKKAPYFKKVAPLGVHDSAIPEFELPKPRPLTIKANFRKDSKSPNQVEIIDVLGNGWYVP